MGNPPVIRVALGSRAARQLVFAGGGRLVAALVGLAGMRLFTELAPPEVFGEAMLILGVMTLGINVLISPVTEAQLRLYPVERDAGRGAEFLRVVLKLALAGGAVLAFLAAGALAIGVWTKSGGPEVAFVLGGLALATAVRSVGLNYLNAERRQIRQTLWEVAEVVARVAFGGILLWLYADPLSLLAAHLLATGGMAALFALAGRGALAEVIAHGRPDPEGTARVLHAIRDFGWPFVIFAVLGWVMSLFDRYALATYLDLASVGQYAAASAISSRLALIPSGVLASVLRPVLYDAATKGDLAKWRRVAGLWLLALVLLGGTILGVVGLFSDLIAALLLAPEYRAGAGAVMFLVTLSFMLLTLAQMFETAYLSHGVPQKLLYSRFVGSGSTILFALLLVPSYGAIGAAMASITGHAGLALVILWLVLGVVRVAAPRTGRT